MPFVCYLAGRIGRKLQELGRLFFEAIAISVGVAVWQESFLRQDDLMAAADSVLYEAKEAG
jgi:GGDEF domain-containing protein